MKKPQITKMIATALLLAIGLVLPFLTGQLPQVGSMLLPLHLPVLLCGFVCGWSWGLMLGLVLPVFRSLIFGMPPMVPTALAMAVEMAAYGAVAGLLYAALPKKPVNVYVALLVAMLAGRVAWGLACVPLYALFTQNAFSLTVFWISGFVKAWPGMLLQIILVPVIVFALERARLIPIAEK